MAAARGPEVVPVRHGETAWSVAQKHTGRTDVPLTDRGREQARALGARLAGREFALVLSSPLQRALETCRLAGLGDRLEVVDDLAEWDYGDYDGLTTAEIRSQHPDWDLWRDGCPGGETPDQVGARADRVVARVGDAGGDCALFAHGHVLRVLAARWIEEAPAHGARLGLSTATLSTLGREHERRVIWLWNDASHLNSPAPPVDR